LIQERTQAGLASARARGRRGGRPQLSSNDLKVLAAKRMHQDKTLPIDEFAKRSIFQGQAYIGIWQCSLVYVAHYKIRFFR
jgi:DNA invertase Pin-like site-specific DNA recombinase